MIAEFWLQNTVTLWHKSLTFKFFYCGGDKQKERMTVTSANEKDLIESVSRFLIGKPLPSQEAAHQTISKKVGLAVFASDALSSTAYATEAILEVLAFAVPVAGAIVLGYSMYIAIAIVILLGVVTISYQQTSHASDRPCERTCSWP